MKKIKSYILKTTIALFALLFAATVPVFAHGADDGVSNPSENRAKVLAAETTEDGSPEGLHRQGDSIVKELREQHKNNKTDVQKQKTCEAHKQGLTKKFSRIVTNSQRAQDRISKILEKTLAYQTSQNLNPQNFDSLTTAAQTAKTTSQASIDALKEVTPTLDCNNVSVASDVATFKAAAQKTRDDLKAYRMAVKDVIKALKTAKHTAAEGSDQ